MSDDDKPKDPWHKKNITDTIKKRKAHRRDLLNVISAMDSQLEYEIARLLKKKGDTVPNYDYINEESDVYDKDLAKKVLEKIEEVYDIDSELHPLKGVIDKANLDKNHYNKRLVEGVYFKHKHELKKHIGKKNFVEIMKEMQGKNRERIGEETQAHAVSDVDSEKHGSDLYGFLKDEYQFDPKKVDEGMLKRDIHEAIAHHMFGNVKKDYFHSKYKKYKKKSE